MPTLTLPEAVALVARLYQARQLGEAETLCRQILQAEPQYPDARRWLGRIAHAAGRQEEALSLIEPLLAMFPKSVELWNDCGVILLALKQRGRRGTLFECARAGPRNPSCVQLATPPAMPIDRPGCYSRIRSSACQALSAIYDLLQRRV